MKVKVTISGIVDLDDGDTRILRQATPENALATLRYLDADIKVKVEGGKKADKEEE